MLPPSRWLPGSIADAFSSAQRAYVSFALTRMIEDLVDLSERISPCFKHVTAFFSQSSALPDGKCRWDVEGSLVTTRKGNSADPWTPGWLDTFDYLCVPLAFGKKPAFLATSGSCSQLQLASFRREFHVTIYNVNGESLIIFSSNQACFEIISV